MFLSRIVSPTMNVCWSMTVDDNGKDDDNSYNYKSVASIIHLERYRRTCSNSGKIYERLHNRFPWTSPTTSVPSTPIDLFSQESLSPSSSPPVPLTLHLPFKNSYETPYYMYSHRRYRQKWDLYVVNNFKNLNHTTPVIYTTVISDRSCTPDLSPPSYWGSVWTSCSLLTQIKDPDGIFNGVWTTDFVVFT